MVDNELFTFRKMYLKDRTIKNLIGTGKYIRHLAVWMSPDRDKSFISASTFMEFYKKLSSMGLDDIEDAFGVNKEYAALMLPSTLIYKRVMELTGAETFWIPGIQMCDGMAAEYGEEKNLAKFGHNFSDDIIATARNMAKRYKCHISHNQALEKYALAIFDSMKKFHGLGKRERLLLQIAVNLH